MRARVAAALLALSLLDVGCATKSYVRHQLAPLSNHVNTLDDVVARNSRDLKAADDRATQSPNALASDASTAFAAATMRDVASVDVAEGDCAETRRVMTVAETSRARPSKVSAAVRSLMLI